MAICHSCHKEFEGTAYRCPSCVVKRHENELYIRSKRKKLGLCIRCGAVLKNNNYLECFKCRNQERLRKRNKNWEKTTRASTVNIALDVIKKVCTDNKLTEEQITNILEESEVGLELVGFGNNNAEHEEIS